tara:strand:- start:1837 stop:3072 length:1236 start_codon:yes stop_codon:yes gene_type:complete
MISANPIGVIELGNLKIKCIIFNDNKEGKLEILSSSVINTTGIHNGVIINIDKASNAIRKCISSAEKKADILLKKINVVIEQPEFLCTKLSKEKKINGSKIYKEDIEFLLKEGKKQVTLNDESHSIIHIFNHSYTVDGKIFLEVPIDVYADNLSHQMTFITVPRNNIKNIIQTFTNCDIEVERFISCIFALGVELLNEEDLNNGSALIDLGFEKTSLGLFKNLALSHSSTFPIGMNHIAKDISKVCSLDLEESQNILKNFDFSFKNNNQFFDDESFLKKNYFYSSNFRKISKSLLLDIIKERINEIFEIIKKNILLAGFGKSFGAKTFIAGGGTNLKNMQTYCSDFFGHEVYKLGKGKGENNKDENLEIFFACFGAAKLIKEGWETEAIPQIIGKYTQKKGFFAKIFGTKH